jgi:lipopolysaccharide/colanic/teichoic acid biosynthesis glycosyltransferase
MEFYGKYGKRFFDLIFSLSLLFLTWPLFLLIAFLIKLSSPGPVFFKQKRVGKKGKIFVLYKFRTMVKEAEKLKEKYLDLNEADGPVFKIRNDPRFINGLGKFLARSGLDELPNIFNVLKGEMSWVGPRPLPIDEEKKISQQVKKVRRSVLPGITSSWVVSGTHNLNFKQWMELDKQYIQKINFPEDLKILSQTVLLCLKMVSRLLTKD